ncbi:MAG: sirohydrochlorin cobaltochelatase [Eggerthellaceae bacterium]|nr:sirohydrochlorin cobaltochelatase [Eggerthellaceae bacterium]
MKGLLSVSFGTSYEETRAKTIDVVDGKLAVAFPDRAFYSAWTSGIIVAKVRKERGETHNTLDEAFARLTEDGIDDLVVATMCLTNGHEMRKIAQHVETWVHGAEGRTACLAEPVLSSEADRKALAAALGEEFADVPEDEVVLLMGHGSPGGPNEVYSQVQDELASLGNTRFVMGTVEGEPTFEDALEQIEASGARRVHLAPFMVVAGDHARNDLAGEDDDSWKSMLEARGYETVVTLRGLGELEAYHELVCVHAQKALIVE